MAARYAESTSVPSEKSRAEIERTLTRYGAETFQYGWTAGRAVIAFVADGRQIRLELPLPDRDAVEFWTTPTGRARTASTAEKEYEQAVRQRWRALALMVKAKLEAVEAEIVSFEDEFLPHTVMPDGRTVAQQIRPAVDHAIATRAPAPLQITAGQA